MACSDSPDIPRPCPRFATHDEWEAWYASLSSGQRLRRHDLDSPDHVYTDADVAKARLRAERRQRQPDPFCYDGDRPDAPWPRVDQIDVPALSNTWRLDPRSGYTPGGFARRMQQAPWRELIEERLPTRTRRDPDARVAWLLEAIAREEAALRAALKRVLRERHGRLSEDERSATLRAMAWSHLYAGRCQLRALRELVRLARADLRRRQTQLTLF